MSTSWKRGSTSAWRKIREFVLRRDGFRCRAHADGWCDMVPGRHTCTVRAELGGRHTGHAHHVYGRAVSGDDPAAIVAACAACNRHIGEPGKHIPQPKPVTRW